MVLAKHSPTALLRLTLGERAPFEEERCQLSQWQTTADCAATHALPFAEDVSPTCP